MNVVKIETLVKGTNEIVDHFFNSREGLRYTEIDHILGKMFPDSPYDMTEIEQFELNIIKEGKETFITQFQQHYDGTYSLLTRLDDVESITNQGSISSTILEMLNTEFESSPQLAVLMDFLESVPMEGSPLSLANHSLVVGALLSILLPHLPLG